MSAVLYDVPGPRSAHRHQLYSGLAAVALTGLVVWVIAILMAEEQLGADKWEAFADPSTIRGLAQGFGNTLTAAGVAVALALGFGALFAVARLSDHVWLRVPAVAVIEFFRAVPLVLLILFVFLGYSSYIGVFWSLVIALMLYNGSVLAEIFRAGILSVPKGQREAAVALGLTKSQVMRLVLVPQAVRTMLPSIISQSVVALKDTALGFIIAYPEAVKATQLTYVYYNNPLQAGVVTAVVFVVINYALSTFAVWLEGRQRRDRTGRPGPTGAEEGRPGPGTTAPGGIDPTAQG